MIQSTGMDEGVSEPPLLPAMIPFIGHIIGVIRNKYTYYVQLSRQTLSPIFTMTIPGTKMYIVTTPDLIQTIQKQPKALTFNPVAAKFTAKICGASADAHKVLMKNVDGREGDCGLTLETRASIQATLAPGPVLDEMNRKMIQMVATSLDGLKVPSGGRIKIDLGKWVFDNVTAATSNAVYGPQHPFRDQTVSDGFWHFENDLMAFLAGLLPSLTARRGVAGRERTVKAFENYFQSGAYKDASLFVRDRYDISIKSGLTIQDLARFELAVTLASLLNTPLITFWTLLYIFSYPELLRDIRNEIDTIITSTTSESGEVTRSIDVTNAKIHCPLLGSTYQEVLRKCSIGTAIREVNQDTVINNRWLLKKDALIQMPSSVIHRDPSVWGSDVDDFNPRRFMKNEPTKTESGKRPSATAFRAFGGGTTLCPGRHFATTEILAVVTMFVMRYDMTPTKGGGEWSMPTTERTKQAAIILEPDHDVEVEVSARKGFEDGRWAFGLKDSGMIFAMVTEDQEE